MMQFVSSQTTLTPQEKKILLNVLTKEKVIDISKAISHEKELDSVVQVRDKQIKELNDKIELLRKEHEQALKEIAIASFKAQEKQSEIDQIEKPKKRFFDSLHLEVGTQYDKSIFYTTSLYYDIDRFRINAGVNSRTQLIFGVSYRLF